jgi:hypothetical protein
MHIIHFVKDFSELKADYEHQLQMAEEEVSKVKMDLNYSQNKIESLEIE